MLPGLGRDIAGHRAHAVGDLADLLLGSGLGLALQAGAFGYILKEQARELIIEQLQRISQGEPPLSPSIARRVIAYFAAQNKPQANALPHVSLTERESEVLLRVAKGFTLPEIGVQLGLSRHTIADYVKQIYRKLNVSSRAEAALEAQRLGLFR